MSFFNAGTTSTTTAAPAEKDIEVPEAPTDSISSLSFSPAADYLAVGSWDNNVSSGRNHPEFSRHDLCIDRCVCMKLALEGRPKARLCIATKDLC
jgi:WD40 repeat protein